MHFLFLQNRTFSKKLIVLIHETTHPMTKAHLKETEYIPRAGEQYTLPPALSY